MREIEPAVVTTSEEMARLGAEIRVLVTEESARLGRISESAARVRRAAGKWSVQEILGHLIDSATNNLQRFVRMQLAPQVELPHYDQNEWVRVNGYQDRPWPELIALWSALNLQVAHVLDRVPPAAVTNTWRMPEGTVVDLAWVAVDYVRHMRHHLGQIAT